MEQLFIGDRVPEKERKVRRKFEIADRVDFTGPQPHGDALAPVQKERARQQTGDDTSDASLEAAVFQAVLVIREKLGHVVVGNRSPVCASGHRRDDFFGAELLGIAFIGVATENSFTTRRRTEPFCVEWTLKLKGIHAVQTILSTAGHEHL